MGQTSKITRVIALGGLLWAAAVQAQESPSITGSYRGPLGQLEFDTGARGRVVGRYADGGPCRFDARRPVVDGELEGQVLVGTVTLCQTGPACEERAYPILAFVHDDASLSAHVKLEPGCQSPALDGTRLVLRQAKTDDVVLTSAKKPVKKTRAACIEDLKKGALLLQKRDYAGASFYFGEGLACNEENWPAHLGIGIAELRRGNVPEAMSAFERARDLSRAEGQEDPGIHFNLACAHARVGHKPQALAAMTRAVELGWADPKAMADDPDLASLREVPEFKALVDRAWDLKERAPKDE